MGKNVTDVGLTENAPKHELKKHAATIHCSNTLSLLQRKISNALLYHAYKELLLKEEHEITVKQLCKLIGYNGNNHAVIKDALKGMLSTVIEWNVVSDTTGQEDWTASSMLASVSLRGPICLYAYSPRMKQLLHSPSMFGKINLFIQSRFKSSYGLALYENCIRYRGLPYTKWFEMDIFRKLMGVPQDKYSIFRDFKRRVLDKSIEEVNTYSDLIVELELGKEGRQVSKVRFLLKERAKKTRLGVSQQLEEESADEWDQLKSKLTTQFGFSLEQAEKILSEYQPEFILEKVSIVESSRNYQEGKIQNIGGYFMSALKHNYQTERKSGELLTRKTIERETALLKKKETQRLVDEIKEDYQLYREKIIDEMIECLNEADKVKFYNDFYRYADKLIHTILRLQKSKYTRQTVLESPQVKAHLRQFATKNLSGLQGQLISLEEFIEKLDDCYREAWQEQETPLQMEVPLE